jgi:hypothetical protein
MHGGKAISREIFTPVTDVTGLDEISDAYFARDFGGWDMQVPTATKIAGPGGGNLPPGATYCRYGPIHSASVVPKSGWQRRGVVSVGRIAAGLTMTTAHTRGRHARMARLI